MAHMAVMGYNGFIYPFKLYSWFKVLLNVQNFLEKLLFLIMFCSLTLNYSILQSIIADQTQTSEKKKDHNLSISLSLYLHIYIYIYIPFSNKSKNSSSILILRIKISDDCLVL